MTSWLAVNWFTLIQTAGVIGGLFYSAVALRLDTKVRRTEVILDLTEAHREIWERLIDRPELVRVLDPTADLQAAPPTTAERRFVLLVLLHLDAVRTAAKEGAYQISSGVTDDVRSFLSLPIPRAVTASATPFQSTDFQSFLAEMLASEGPMRGRSRHP